MTATLDSRQVSPRLKHPAQGQILHRLVGVGFAAAAVGNAIGTMRQVPSFVRWLADSARIPPYPWLLEHWMRRILRLNDGRPPLLFISGARSSLPSKVVHSNAKHYKSKTQIVEFDGPHLLPAIDGWEEVADFELDWALNAG